MTDYIKFLRDHVGHAPILLCGASVIVEDPQGRVLLQQRRDNQCWGYAGGAVELGERVEDAARRELLEETGLVADALELFRVFSGPELHYVYPNGDEVSIVDILFICRAYHGRLICGETEESLHCAFFPLDALPGELSPPCVMPLRCYADWRGQCQ